MDCVTTVNLEGLTKIHKGKVRELYDIDDEKMLVVATDRFSAFDVVFDEGIPGKGKILTQISNYWFSRFDVPNHIIETDVAAFPAVCKPYADVLRDRAVVVRKAKRVDFECIVRGYIIGSGWKSYQKEGSICGIRLPNGLRLADKLPEPIFTPTTKADIGEHDENVNFATMANALGKERAEALKALSIAVYTKASEELLPKGIILADTKFEFGIVDDEVILIDECLTPDSSRFWDASTYAPGSSPQSYDKQILRDYLDSLDWNKEPPAPTIPADTMERARARYEEVLTLITGERLS